jgi:hypothetical protein
LDVEIDAGQDDVLLLAAILAIENIRNREGPISPGGQGL